MLLRKHFLLYKYKYYSLKTIRSPHRLNFPLAAVDQWKCKIADFGFARDIMANNMYERKTDGRLPIR